MNQTDYIPGADDKFDDLQRDAIATMTANALPWGIPAPVLAALAALALIWTNAYAVVLDAGNFTSTDVQAKNTARRNLTTALRSAIQQYVMKNRVVTDANRVSMGLKPRDTVPTRASVMSVAPILSIDQIVHLLQMLRFANPEDPDTKAIPKKQKVVLEYFVGNAGIAVDQINFDRSVNVTHFRKKITFDISEVGKTVYYRCCYENSRGERGPWSMVMSVVIA